jgi:hypothetical protein
MGAFLSAGPAGIVAAVGVAIAGAIAVGINASGASSSKSKTTYVAAEPEPEPIDLTIPYDAAAALSYCSFKGISEVEDTGEYGQFKTVYEAFTVAEVTLKKASRDYNAFKAAIKANDIEGA